MNTLADGPLAWFARCGAPPNADERALAQAWVDALGESAPIVFVGGWRDAATWLRAHRFANGYGEREDVLRGALRDRARARLAETALLDRLTAATQPLVEPLREAAEAAVVRDGHDDEGLIRAAAGAAALAQHQRALAQLAGAPAAHPFFCKHRLFARGRWPLGVFDDAGRAVAAIL